MARRDIIVIGASAGGLPALTDILRRMPADIEAVLLVVMHMRPDSDGVLPDLLQRSCALPVTFARDGDRIRYGHVYVARPDCHLLATGETLRVVRGPRENGFRPAIDPLFRTAARTLDGRVIGVILSGALSDGTYGLSVIKQAGGVAIVQDPADAVIPSMPLSAIKQVDIDYVLPAAGIAETLIAMTGMDSEREEGTDAMARSNGLEPQLQAESTRVSEMKERYGSPSALTCPDCGGALWEIEDDGVLRYQCHVGHQYASDSLDAEQRDAIDGALWSAVRVLEEHAELRLRMAQRTAANGLTAVSKGFEQSARDSHQQAQQIRGLLFGAGGRAEAPPRGSGRAQRPAGASHRAAKSRKVVRRRR